MTTNRANGDRTSRDREYTAGRNPSSGPPRWCRGYTTIELPGPRNLRTGNFSQPPDGGPLSCDCPNSQDCRPQRASRTCSQAHRPDNYADCTYSPPGKCALPGYGASRCSLPGTDGYQQLRAAFPGTQARKHASGGCCADRKCNPLNTRDAAWCGGGKYNLQGRAGSYTYLMTSPGEGVM
jgi:hypothetical protein